MIAQILNVKKYREQSIRSSLLSLTNMQVVLNQEEDKLNIERQRLWAEWRLSSSKNGLLSQVEFRVLQSTLGNCYKRDRVIEHRIEALHAEGDRLKVSRAEYVGLLRKNLLEQEKLIYLMEQDDEQHIST